MNTAEIRAVTAEMRERKVGSRNQWESPTLIAWADRIDAALAPAMTHPHLEGLTIARTVSALQSFVDRWPVIAEQSRIGDQLDGDMDAVRDAIALIKRMERIKWTRALAALPGGGVDGYVLLPRKLTAENGAKGLLSGEFCERITIPCPGDDCDEDFGEDCPVCDGRGEVTQQVPVSWDTIKRIHDAVVENLSLPTPNPHEADRNG